MGKAVQAQDGMDGTVNDGRSPGEMQITYMKGAITKARGQSAGGEVASWLVMEMRFCDGTASW